MDLITENIKRILGSLPDSVVLAAAAKTRSAEEVAEALNAGVKVIGQNYVQEGEMIRQALGSEPRMHFIGHLQRNKVKKAVRIFDLIETVDNLEIAEEINKRCAAAGKTMPILIEVNSGREVQKFGVLPEDLESLVTEIAQLPHILVKGLMTMGPYSDYPEDARPFFVETKLCYDRIAALTIPNIEMKILSMGMTHSYRIAIEEGANMIRIGTGIFGPR